MGRGIDMNDDKKLYILAVSTDFVSMCFINTMEMYESGISISSYYVMCGEERLTSRIEL